LRIYGDGVAWSKGGKVAESEIVMERCVEEVAWQSAAQAEVRVWRSHAVRVGGGEDAIDGWIGGEGEGGRERDRTGRGGA
jgi:hypothetical protein